MTKQNDADPELAARFAALRAEDAATTPVLSVPSPAPRRRVLPLLRVAALVASVGGIGWWLASQAPAPRLNASLAIDLGSTMWVGPTDFLLKTPGVDLLRTVPRIGASHLRSTVKDSTVSSQPTDRRQQS